MVGTAFLIVLQGVFSLSTPSYEPSTDWDMSQWLLLVFLSLTSLVTFYHMDGGGTESVNMTLSSS